MIVLLTFHIHYGILIVSQQFIITIFNSYNIPTREACGTVTKEISFDFDTGRYGSRYDSQASVFPELYDPSYQADRIIGGVDANPGEVPWQVNLLLYGDSVTCGGTLVSSTVIFQL